MIAWPTLMNANYGNRYSADLGKAYMKHNGMPSTAPYDPPANWVSASGGSVCQEVVLFDLHDTDGKPLC